MGKSNVAIRQWLSQKERFLNFVNGALFQGVPIFKAENLEMEDGQQGLIVKTAEGKEITIERYRDITMTAQMWFEETKSMMVACENQDEIHYAMPVRNMLYDALSYVEQVGEMRRQHRADKELHGSAEFLSGLKKTDVLCPVITIVFYYGEEAWDGKKEGNNMCQALEEYYQDGVDEGKDCRLIQLVIKKVKKNKTLSVIADEFEEAEDTIQDIYEMVRQNLEKSVKEIYLLIHNEKQ